MHLVFAARPRVHPRTIRVSDPEGWFGKTPVRKTTGSGPADPTRGALPDGSFRVRVTRPEDVT
jgi:hypothetical protein